MWSVCFEKNKSFNALPHLKRKYFNWNTNIQIKIPFIFIKHATMADVPQLLQDREMVCYVMAWRLSVSVHIISSHFRVERLKPTILLMIIVKYTCLRHMHIPFGTECRRWSKFIHTLHQVKKEVCFFPLKQMWHVVFNSINKFLAHTLPLSTQMCCIEFTIGDLKHLIAKRCPLEKNIFTNHSCSTLDKHSNTAFIKVRAHYENGHLCPGFKIPPKERLIILADITIKLHPHPRCVKSP